MDPLVTSSLISAGGNFLGGLFGGDKGPGFMETMNNSRQMQAKMNRGAYNDAAWAADNFGLNRLVTMAGINPAGGPAVSAFGGSGSELGDTLRDMGHGISRAAEAYMTREDRVLQRTNAALEVENKKLQNDRLAAEIRLMQQPGTPPGLPGAIPRSIFLQDRDGKVTEVLNPDAGDNEFLMAQDWMTRTLPQDVANMARRSYDKFAGGVRRVFSRRSSYRGLAD